MSASRMCLNPTSLSKSLTVQDTYPEPLSLSHLALLATGTSVMLTCPRQRYHFLCWFNCGHGRYVPVGRL